MSSQSQPAEDKPCRDEIFILDASNVGPDAEFGGLEERHRLERKLLWKLDCRLVFLVFIFILNYIDRNNVAAARLKGLEEDLNLKGQQFNTLLSMLYVGYTLMQVPSNMFMNHIGRPSAYLSMCVVIWGVISCLTGITKNFIQALFTRFFLGFIEAAYVPGVLFLISKWYTRSELGLRIAIFYCGNTTSNAFGSLLASAILDTMDGKLGHAGWRWLFYIEGALTVAVAFLSIFIIPNFPTTAKWLSPQERSLAVHRMAEDGRIHIDDQEGAERAARGMDTAEKAILGALPKFGKSARLGYGFLLAISDWRIWYLSITFAAQSTAMSFNAFFPTLGETLNLGSTAITLVAISPPWFIAAAAALWNSKHSDKQGERYYHIVIPLLFSLAGFIIAMSTMNTVARYIALCLMCLSYTGFAIMLAWIPNSIPRPPSKRAVSIAFINTFATLGNISGSYLWPTKWAPTYKKSFGICTALQCLNIVMLWFFRRHLRSLNDKMEKSEQNRGVQEKGFRYLL